MYTPAPPHDPSKPHESSEHEGGSNITANMYYQPLSESAGDVLMSEAEIGSLPSPLGKTVSEGKKELKRGGKKAIVFAKEESGTEPDDELTPFKNVMSEKGKRFGKDVSINAVEEMPIKVMMKWKEKVPVRAGNSATEDDKLVISQNTGNVKAAPAAAGLASGSGKKYVQPIPAPT